MRIGCADEQQQRTKRLIWPVATLYYLDVTLVGAWCELRQGFRHFRADRIEHVVLLEGKFATDGRTLTSKWMEVRAAEAPRAKT